jgi:hypothetical protein
MPPRSGDFYSSTRMWPFHLDFRCRRSGLICSGAEQGVSTQVGATFLLKAEPEVLPDDSTLEEFTQPRIDVALASQQLVPAGNIQLPTFERQGRKRAKSGNQQFLEKVAPGAYSTKGAVRFSRALSTAVSTICCPTRAI